MATTNDSRSVSVIGPQFISPKPLILKIETYVVGKLVITDINNKIIFKVKSCDATLHRQRWILDADDRPIVKIREKCLTAHNRWNVFKGESKADLDIIFTTRKNSIIQFKTCVNVYLGNKKNCNDDHHDFQIKGNWSKKNCSIHMGDSKTAIAQMNMVKPLENMKSEKDNFMVTIDPNVDYAFVVALITVVDAMNSSDPNKAKTAKGVGGMIDIMGAVTSN